MTQIKRYTKEELENKCREIFFDYLLNGKEHITRIRSIKCSHDYPTPLHLLHKEYMDAIHENNERRHVYHEFMNQNPVDKALCKSIAQELALLDEEYEVLVNMNMQTQIERKKATGSVHYSMTSVRIPLNKKINSYYDDFILEVLFYDNISTPAGLFEDFKRVYQSGVSTNDFLKNNIQITHMGLVIPRADNRMAPLAVIGLYGDLVDEEEQKSDIYIFKSKYADFVNLSLQETSVIKNNDIRQFFQSKIDLDKEDLTLLATKFIRGDEYKLYIDSASATGTYYIRYVCPSTDRIYYNELDLKNLKLSDYFNIDNYESYLDSWWNITHLGAPIEGKPVISC